MTLLPVLLRGSLPVKPATQGNDHPTQVSHNILGPLIGIPSQDGWTLHRQCHLPVLETKAHQPVRLLDQDDRQGSNHRPAQ